MSVKVETSDPNAEGTLVEAAIGGDAEAFARLYDLHADRVYRHIYYRIGNRDDSEDLTQQVFLQAWRAIGRYERTKTPFIAWLLTIAYHSVVSHARRAKDVAPIDLEPVARERWSDPEAEALARFDRLEVRRAILRLKPDYQHVIVMRFVEHFDYPAIAAALGKSEGNVRVIQHRALLELRRLLSHEVQV
jgi:RNA polymerase sigma-70 factor (ECF subfamily)